MNKPLRVAVRKFDPFERAIKKIWAEFCAVNGCDVTLEMVAMDLHPLYESLFAEQGLAKGDWDIAHLNTDWLFEASTSGAIENLRPFIDKDAPEDFPLGWSSSLLQMQQSGDKVFGLPFHDGPECLIYRKDLFEDELEKKQFAQQFGRPLQVPRTWDEFLLVARFFQRPTQHLYGTAFAGYPDGHNTVFDFCLQLWTRGGELTNEAGKINVKTSQARDGLHFYRQVMQDKESIHPGSKEFDSVQAGLAFARGEVAMMVNWFGFASMCEVIEDSNVRGKVDITQLPSGNNGSTASLNVYWLYTIASGSTNKQLAYDFISYAVNKNNDKLLTLEGGIGCRISTWEDPEVNALVPYYHRLRELHQYAKSLPAKSNWAAIAALLDELVLATVNSDKPVGEILRECQQKIELLD